jgi:serine protease Do
MNQLPGHRRRRTAATMMAVALGTAVLALPAGPAVAASTENAPANATELAAAAYPGIQLIETDFDATLSVPVAELDNSALKRLQQRLARGIITGAVDATQKGIVDALVEAIAADPLTYFRPSKTLRTTSASLSGFGTGWVVTPDGYIVTAAHVVSPDEAELKQQFAQSGLEEFVKEDAQAFASTTGTKFTGSQLAKLTDASAAFNAHYLKVGKISKAVSAQLGVAVAGFDKAREGKPVEVISVGEGYPGKDVAVLKIDGQTDLPTLPIGVDTDVQEGETLYVAGYPAASTFFSGLSKDSEVQPSVTQGPLTAKRSNESGTPIFQTQAPASPGNSGGPVLDKQGHVIGILVASAVDDKGVALEGQEFVVPISVITEKLNQSNIKPRTSPITVAYSEALGNYYQKYYKRALPQFQHVKNLYGAHPYVAKYISDTQAAIDAGKDETPTPIWMYVMIGGGVVLVLLLAVLVAMLVRRCRWPAAGPVPYPQYAFAGYPGQPGPGQQGPGGYPQQQPPGYQQGYPQQYPQQAPPGYQGQPYPAQPYQGQPQAQPQPGQSQPGPSPAPPQPQPGDGQTPPPPPW